MSVILCYICYFRGTENEKPLNYSTYLQVSFMCTLQCVHKSYYIVTHVSLECSYRLQDSMEITGE